MNRFMLAALAALALGASSGCCILDRLFCCPWGACHDSCGGYEGSVGGCDSCGIGHGGGGCADGLCHSGRGGSPSGLAADASTAQGAVVYPYYTNRGPRDFLARNPRSIGP